MDSVIDFFFGVKEDLHTNHYEASSDTILPMTHDARSVYNDAEIADRYEENSYDDLLEDDDSARQQAEDPVYARQDRESRQWIDHIMNACHDRYPSEPRSLVSLVYQIFSQEYPALETLNYDALEYIRNKAEYNTKELKEGRFKCIFYSNLVTTREIQPVAAVPIPGVQGVFLVNLQHDYVYGRAIECALLRRDRQLFNETQLLFNQRRELVKPCDRDHMVNEKLCPSEWTLYVNQSSEFYAFCSRQLKDLNPMIDHNITKDYVNAEVLSFYLVLFLCGEMMEPVIDFAEPLKKRDDTISFDDGFVDEAPTIASAYYTTINQWKKLPIWFLDVWYSGHRDPRDRASNEINDNDEI